MKRLSLARVGTPWATLVSLLATLIARQAVAEDDNLPMMDRERAVTCLKDSDGQPWRLQCNEDDKRCIYAPDGELDERGKIAKSLERARYCLRSTDIFDPGALQAKGYRVERGLPDAPHGWMRDFRGRVFQVNFDLKRRLYIGAGYAPRKLGMDGQLQRKRSSLDFGMFVFEHYHRRTRHRLRLIEGEVNLEPFSGKMTLLHYDLSRRYKNPLVRLTTFFGTPRRYDLNLNVGMWLEAGRLEIHSAAEGAPNMGDDKLWKLFALHGTLDLWQSPRLTSFVRLRGGLGMEGASATGDGEATRAALTPGGAIEADITIDPAGFHHLGAEISYERPLYYRVDPRVGDHAERMGAELDYEVIILALNDQPLSLRLAVGAEKRNDSPVIADRWAAKANAGLRFSLWAPPRSR